MNPSKKSTPELVEAINEIRPLITKAAWFSVMSSLLILAPSLYMLEVYDRVINSRNHLTLAMLTLLVIGAYVVMEMMDWARQEILRGAGDRFDNRLRGRVVNLMFEANLKKLPGGNFQTMLDFRTLRDFISSKVVLSVMEIPVGIVFVVIIYAVNPLLGWVALLGAAVQTLIAWFNEKSTRPPLMQANMLSASSRRYADSTLRNAQVIESMGMMGSIYARWKEVQENLLISQARASDYAGVFKSLAKFWQMAISSALLGLACFALLRNELNGGPAMMIVASILGGRILAPLLQVVTQWQMIVGARQSWDRLGKVMESLPASPPRMPLPAPRGILMVDNLVASAPNTAVTLLRGINFAANPGEVVAVVGPSAAGKTTLARLLVGLWPASNGKVRLDGVDVYTWDKSELGPHIGYMPQGVQLFDGTIADNIARFGLIDMGKVEAAANAVGLHALILAMPNGYQTQVGREGGVLSGGQRQRIALARALYDDPVFVVLDEPNSSLDDAGDAALAQGIRYMKSRGTTFVIMTHRTSILAVTDKILVLRDGQMQSFGPRDEILAALNQPAQPTTPSGHRPLPATAAIR